MANLTSYVNNFTPQTEVQNCHNIPHLNSHLQAVSNTFGLYYNSLLNSYSKSLITLPVLVGVLGILGLLIFNLSLCFRKYCCSSCRLVQNEPLLDTDYYGDTKVEDKSGRYLSVRTLKIMFYVFAAITLISDQSVFFGNQYIDQAIVTANDALDFLDNTFQSLVNEGNNLQSDSSNLDAQLSTVETNGQCPALTASYATIQSDLDSFNVNVQDYNNYVDPLPGYVTNVQNSFKKYVIANKNNSVWALYVIVLVAAGIYLVGVWFKSKCTLQLGIVWGQLLILALIIICAVEMVIIVGVADFCISPTLNTLQLNDPGGSNYPLLQYYTTCTGENPLSAPLSTAYAAIADLNDALVALDCPSALSSAFATTASIQTTLYSIGNTTACGPLESEANTVLHTGICYQTFLGFFVIWASQYVTCAALFLMTIVASILYQYYGMGWDMEQEQVESSSRGAPNSTILVPFPQTSEISDPHYVAYADNDKSVNYA